MNVLTNLIYGENEQKDIVTKDQVYLIDGIVISVEEWEEFYININEKIFVLRRDNVNFDDLLKFLVVNSTVSINYIKDKDDNRTITTKNDSCYFVTTIKGLETDFSGDTYITTSPPVTHNEQDYNIILKRNYCIYHNLYNKLKINETVSLIMILRNDYFKILGVTNVKVVSSEIAIIGTIDIYNEVNDLKDFIEVVYKNHKEKYRFLISKTDNDLIEKRSYKITCTKFHSGNFYKIITHELMS